MKKYVITAVITGTIMLTGCGMSKERMMMLDEMKMQLNEIQFQVNSNAAAADRAKDMAEEALIKASKGGSSRHMMHQKRMMK